jgi:hypothetical protein
MATMTKTAPYVVGDFIEFQVDGVWHEAIVLARTELHTSNFGLHWSLLVKAPGLKMQRPICDDEGRNYTLGSQVRPMSADL